MCDVCSFAASVCVPLWLPIMSCTKCLTNLWLPFANSPLFSTHLRYVYAECKYIQGCMVALRMIYICACCYFHSDKLTNPWYPPPFVRLRMQWWWHWVPALSTDYFLTGSPTWQHPEGGLEKHSRCSHSSLSSKTPPRPASAGVWVYSCITTQAQYELPIIDNTLYTKFIMDWPQSDQWPAVKCVKAYHSCTCTVLHGSVKLPGG